MSTTFRKTDIEYYLLVNKPELYRRANELGYESVVLFEDKLLRQEDLSYLKENEKALMILFYEYESRVDLMRQLQGADINYEMNIYPDHDHLFYDDEVIKSIEELTEKFPEPQVVEKSLAKERLNYIILAGYSTYYVKAPKAIAGKKSFTVKWGKQSKANLKKFNGYQIRYSTKKSMAKAKMVKVKKTASSKTIKKLKKKTKYFVQVRTYTKKSGKLFYSKWSAKKTVKTK